MPVRWQGWLVLLAYFGLLYAGIYSLAPSRGSKAFLIFFLGLTALLIVVLLWKGERPLRFRWGGK
jgi:hypothetical protein